MIRNFDQNGKELGYYHDFGQDRFSERSKASGWLRENPHRLNLGLIGLKMYDENHREIGMHDITNPRQILNLWKGEMVSYFEVGGTPVEVITVCHPDRDMVSVKISRNLNIFIQEADLLININASVENIAQIFGQVG